MPGLPTEFVEALADVLVFVAEPRVLVGEALELAADEAPVHVAIGVLVEVSHDIGLIGVEAIAIATFLAARQTRVDEILPFCAGAGGGAVLPMAHAVSIGVLVGQIPQGVAQLMDDEMDGVSVHRSRGDLSAQASVLGTIVDHDELGLSGGVALIPEALAFEVVAVEFSAIVVAERVGLVFVLGDEDVEAVHVPGEWSVVLHPRPESSDGFLEVRHLAIEAGGDEDQIDRLAGAIGGAADLLTGPLRFGGGQREMGEDGEGHQGQKLHTFPYFFCQYRRFLTR